MAEAEYISKEAALACFSDWIDRYGHEHSADEMAEYQRIEDLPVEDVVEVVRCKDCKFSRHTDGEDLSDLDFKCVFNGKYVSDEWFCADGVRREPND